ncbi:MAG: hypothetical protein ACI8PV_000915 [Dinoroseobacter sp.]|jgi:hypothetical protein
MVVAPTEYFSFAGTAFLRLELSAQICPQMSATIRCSHLDI